jgi:hypothetical protein
LRKRASDVTVDPVMSAHDYGDDVLSPLQTRQLLGVSRTRILQFEERGELHPVRDERGVHRYLRSEVERLIRVRAASPDKRVTRVGARLPGEIVARVFELFDEGWTLPQIVRETRLPPEAIRALHVEYRTPVEQPSPGHAVRPAPLPPARSRAASPAERLKGLLADFDAHSGKEKNR